MVLIGILVGLFFLFALIGGVYMYFYAVVRDHSGKRQENLWEKEIAPHPGYSEESSTVRTAPLGKTCAVHVSAEAYVRGEELLVLFEVGNYHVKRGFVPSFISCDKMRRAERYSGNTAELCQTHESLVREVA